MKFSKLAGFPSSASFLRGLLALGAGAFLAPSSGAAVLLIVDVSDPAAISITATGAAPSANDQGNDNTWTFDGVDLLEFFTADAGGDAGGSLGSASSLKPTGSVNIYNEWLADFFSTDGGDFLDLNLYYNDFVPDPQNFDTTQPAFSGSATLDLTDLVALLPAPGTSGLILAGYSDFAGPVIGEWTVVPEVSPGMQAAVFGLGAAGLLLLRRNRRHRA